MKRGGRGVALPAVMAFIFIAGILFQLSFLRYTLGLQQARQRYLDGVALDAAENGLVIALRGGAVARESMGTFAGNQCFIEAEGGGGSVTARGICYDARGQVSASREIQVAAARDATGRKISSWVEGPPAVAPAPLPTPSPAPAAGSTAVSEPVAGATVAPVAAPAGAAPAGATPAPAATKTP